MKNFNTRSFATLVTIILTCWSNLLSAQWDTIAAMEQHYSSVYLTTHNNTLYASGNNGVYTYNSGQWNELTQGTFQSASNANNEVVFVGSYIYVRSTTIGIYRSADGGASWEMDTAGLKEGNSLREPVSLFADGSYVYTSIGWPTYAFFRKQPGDAAWTRINDISANNVIVWGLAKKGTDLYAAVSNGCWASTDGGLTWTQKTSTGFPLISGNWALVGAGNRFITHNAALYYGSDNGIYRSTDDGDSWTRIDSGFQVTFGGATISAIHSDGNVLYAATRNSNHAYMSTDHGDTWTDVSAGLDGKITSIATWNGAVYATLFNKLNVYTMGGGATWVPAEPAAVSFAVYPNPASTHFTLDGVPLGSTLRVMDMAGKLVYATVLSESAPLTISTESFVPGIYLLQVESQGRLGHRKLVVR